MTLPPSLRIPAYKANLISTIVDRNCVNATDIIAYKANLISTIVD